MRIAKVFSFVSLFLSIVAVQALAADHTVMMSGDYQTMFFDPATITITVGDRVHWQNITGLQHTATSGVECTPDFKWASGIMDPGQTSAYITFNTVGEFAYYCKFHCAMGMSGTVFVNAPIPVRQKTWGSVKALFAALTTSP